MSTEDRFHPPLPECQRVLVKARTQDGFLVYLCHDYNHDTYRWRPCRPDESVAVAVFGSHYLASVALVNTDRGDYQGAEHVMRHSITITPV